MHRWNHNTEEGPFVQSSPMDWFSDSFTINKEEVKKIKELIMNHINNINTSNYTEAELTICNDRIY